MIGKAKTAEVVMPEAPKEMATAEPTRGAAPQGGVKMQPPAPSQAPAVDYGQMMEQALADPTGVPAMKPVLPPLMDTGNGAAAGSGAMPGGNPAVAGAPKEMPGEPVANPFMMTLPPPPAPAMGPDMMPPAMPGR